MAPTDSSPTHMCGFEIISSLDAYSRIPVYEFKSRRTGLTVVIAEVEGPVVNGYFCLATEAHDDDGLPHTLEHLIFLGSEQYPYKGVLDLLANRCLASGTNAWTDIDHTCYTMETAGSEGFLSLMPIFLEHILYPTLTDEGFLTEVHHITEKGEDAGVVYCEMQGRENSGESRVHLTMSRAMYPGHCGYSSETGGIMKNLRESTSNEKVRNYHKDFYRPENLKVIITGQVKPEDVFKALSALEEKIVTKGERGPFTRPWQDAVPALPASLDKEVKYPCDEESNGIVSVAWRGPAVTEQYMLSAASIVLKYLTDLSVSPLQKEFVEIPDPFASKVAFNLYENSESVLYLLFENVPKAKLAQVKPLLMNVLKKMVDAEDIDMNRMKCVLHRHKLESLSNLENNPHQTVAFMIIGHMLYGQNKDDLKQRLNPIIDLEKMESEPKSFWIDLIKKYFIESNVIAICGVPSIDEQHVMAEEEKQRIEAQIALLTEDGLKQKGKELDDAITFNDKPPPTSMLTSVPIPSADSINFHEIMRYSSSEQNDELDLSKAPVFTYFDHVNTNFVYMFVLMDTSAVPQDLRLYLPLLLEAFFESPVKRGDVIVSYEDVVSELESDTVVTRNHIGLGTSGRFSCGPYSHTVSIMLQVEEAKYKRGLEWLRELLYQTQFNAERLHIIATKMANDVAQIKRKGNKVAADLMKGLCYVKDSNQYNNSMLRQQKFLTELLEKLKKTPNIVLDSFEEVRKIITRPSNMVLYLAANITHLKDDPVEALQVLLPETETASRKNLNVTQDSTLMLSADGDSKDKSCVVGMGCIESSFLYHVTPSINTYDDPDVPALMTYLQYITQLEGPLWKQVRGKGLTYGYNICLKANEGLLYLVFSRATNVVGAFKEAQEIVSKQVDVGVWDSTLLESAKSSLIFEIIENEKTIGHVVEQSLISYFKNVDLTYNRWLVSQIGKVTEEDLNRVGKKYVAQLFSPANTRTTIVCHPAKADEVAAGFKELNYDLNIYPTLEKSFLNDW